MTKNELAKQAAEKTGSTIKDALKAVDALTEIIKTEVAAGQKVQIIGFGSFEPRIRAARTGTNPVTGAKIVIPASVVPAFKAGKEFKELVNHDRD